MSEETEGENQEVSERPKEKSTVLDVISEYKGLIMVATLCVAGIAAAVGGVVQDKRKNDQLKNHVRSEVVNEGVDSLKAELKVIIGKLKEMIATNNLFKIKKESEERKCELTSGRFDAKYDLFKSGTVLFHEDYYKITKTGNVGGLDDLFVELNYLCYRQGLNDICIEKNGGRLMQTTLAGVSIDDDRTFDMEILGNEHHTAHFDEWEILLSYDSNGKVESVGFIPVVKEDAGECKGQVALTDLTVNVDDPDLIKLVMEFLVLHKKYQEMLKKAEKKPSVRPTDEEIDTLSSKEFYQKLQRGIVLLELRIPSTKTGRTAVSGCTGFIYDERTVITAGHCVEDMIGVENVRQLVPNGEMKKPKVRTVSGARSAGFGMRRYGGRDLGVIIFNKPVFDKKDALKISDGPLSMDPLYVMRFGDTGKGGKRVDWQLNRYLPQSFSGDYDTGLISMYPCMTISGNSGSPVVNSKGEVVAVHTSQFLTGINGMCRRAGSQWVNKRNIKRLLKLM